jgi:GDPmannose 4,6-dehydratase
MYDRLLSQGWEILGIGKDGTRSTAGNHSKVDISFSHHVARAVKSWHPDAIFYLAALHGSSQQSHDLSDDMLFERSLAVNVQGVVNFLEHLPQGASLFYAASSHVFGKPDSELQDESTEFRPTSIYGITKTAGILACRFYRNTRNARASVGILYNHESPLRRREFVTTRVVEAAVAISRGEERELLLGDLSARVDWGYAPDYVDAMIRIAQLSTADDYIIATGETHSVQELVDAAFSCVNLDWRDHVRVDSTLLRRESWSLAGNSRKLRDRTGWAPTIGFTEMIHRLVDAEKTRVGD